MTKKRESSRKTTTKETSASTDIRLVEAVELMAESLAIQAQTGIEMVKLQQRSVTANEKLANTNKQLEAMLAK